MKIEKPYYSFDNDFNVKDTMQILLNGGLGLTRDGTIGSFICPIQTKANGESMNFESALNVCYIIPDVTKEETVMFGMLYNDELIKTLKERLNVDNVANSSMIITVDNKFAGGSCMKYADGFGLGWHFVFLSDPSTKVNGIETGKVKIDLPLNEELSKNLHGELDTRFHLLSNHIFITSLSLSNLNEP